MHELEIIATDVPVAWALVSLFVTRLHPAKTTERTEVLFGTETPGCLWNTVPDASPDHRRWRGSGKVLPFVPRIRRRLERIQYDNRQVTLVTYISVLYACCIDVLVPLSQLHEFISFPTTTSTNSHLYQPHQPTPQQPQHPQQQVTSLTNN